MASINRNEFISAGKSFYSVRMGMSFQFEDYLRRFGFNVELLEVTEDKWVTFVVTPTNEEQFVTMGQHVADWAAMGNDVIWPYMTWKAEELLESMGFSK